VHLARQGGGFSMAACNQKSRSVAASEVTAKLARACESMVDRSMVEVDGRQVDGRWSTSLAEAH
ncbi:MAG: hypothetical protein ACREJX_18350, partial [Polyangiaceae bacterium]